MQYRSLLLIALVLSVSGRFIKQRSSDVTPSGQMPKPDMKFTTEPLKATTTTLGSSVTLSCAGTATIGTPTISWVFSSKVDPDVTTWTVRSGGTSGTLILGNLQKDEGGYYFCQLTDPYGYRVLSRGALVVVTYLEAQFKQFPTSQTISNSRNYVSLPCQAPESNPAATINWYKDGVLIQNVENMFQEYKNKEEYGNLIIFNPLTTDSGKYVCEAVNTKANPELRSTPEADIQIQVDGSGSYTQKFVTGHDLIVDKGKDAVLRAGAIGDPSPQYKWTLGLSAEVDISDGSRFSVSDNGRELRIQAVEVADRGTYWSQYMNSYSSGVSVVRLYVQEDVVFENTMSAKTVEYLTPETFDCQCSGTPYTDGDPTKPPSALWLRDGDPIVDGDRFREVDGNLVTTGLTMSESGMYQCFCYNTREIIQSSMSVTVKNTTIPVSIAGKSLAEGVYNKDIDVYCRANGRPLPLVTWYKDSDEITSVYDNRYQLTQQNGDDYVLSKLRVTGVRAEDAGMLTCRAVNYKVSQFTAELLITFVVGNEIAPSISFNDVSIQLNREITLSSVAHGYPFPAIRWFKDGVELATRGRYMLDGTSLYIDGTQSSDTGVYMVLANNGVGSPASANATITLEAQDEVYEMVVDESTNSAAVIGSVGGIGGFLFLTSLCILFYVLIRQKQRKEYVPPIDAKTPHEEQIENSGLENGKIVATEVTVLTSERPPTPPDEIEDVKVWKPANEEIIEMKEEKEDEKHAELRPPTPPEILSDVKSWELEVEGVAFPSEKPSGERIEEGTLIARDSDVSGPSTETSKSSSSSSSDSSSSDSGSANSKKKIIKKKGRKTKRVAPMDMQ